jgi:hypothetical protein
MNIASFAVTTTNEFPFANYILMLYSLSTLYYYVNECFIQSQQQQAKLKLLP